MLKNWPTNNFVAKHIRNGCIFMLVVSSSVLIFVTLVQFQNVTTGNNWFGHILELTEFSTNLKLVLTHLTFQKKYYSVQMIIFCAGTQPMSSQATRR